MLDDDNNLEHLAEILRKCNCGRTASCKYVGLCECELSTDSRTEEPFLKLSLT